MRTLLISSCVISLCFGCDSDEPPTDTGVDSGVADSAVVDSAADVSPDSAPADTAVADTAPGDTGTGDTGMAGDAAAPTRLSLVEGCDPAEHINAAAGEHGHWYAAVLVPPSYPFTVTAIEYMLANGSMECDVTTEHLVQVYTLTDTTVPPADPTVIHELTITEPTSTEARVIVSRTLPSPVVLTTGQNIVIAVEMLERGPDGVCVSSCFPSDFDDQVYWSNTADPPYAWTTLASFGASLDGAPKIEALGFPGG